MYSHKKEHRIFYCFLLGIISIHVFLMMHKLRDSQASLSLSSPTSIKVKIIQDENKVIQKTKRQIVQSEDSLNSEKKDDAFLSDKTRSFDRQTVAKNIDIFKKAGKGNAHVDSMGSLKSSSSKKTRSPQKELKLSDIGVEVEQMKPQKMPRSPASESRKGIENGDINSMGLSATNDYVQEMQLGDFTQLNTVEYKYYGFFHRIRQKLEQFWGRSIQEKSQMIFRSGRSIASQDYVTSLQVTLNEKGEIVAVKILGASGVRELDDAAVESFNKAGPFPNPPKDLLVNGKATIEWGFVVKS